MRAIAIGLNFLVLGAVLYLFLSSDPGYPKGKDLALMVLFLVAPIASLVALDFSGRDGWLTLFLKRKALEEKKRIERLNGPN
jgi:hypothetical protein